MFSKGFHTLTIYSPTHSNSMTGFIHTHCHRNSTSIFRIYSNSRALLFNDCTRFIFLRWIMHSMKNASSFRYSPFTSKYLPYGRVHANEKAWKKNETRYFRKPHLYRTQQFIPSVHATIQDIFFCTRLINIYAPFPLGSISYLLVPPVPIVRISP